METKILFFSFFLLLLAFSAFAQMPGFVSLDCGGKQNFTDELGLVWTSDDNLIYGETAIISVANETRKQYMTLRHFPADSRKYCYTLGVISRSRYLLRATFLYGNFDNNNVYPKFDISFGATHWSTIVISDANTIESIELIFLASSPTISVCLSNATTGQPFISTLELRQFNGSVYYTDYENQFYLSVSARINFGADSEDPVRYPDDPFDRIWESDSVKKANYLVDVAAGTQKVSTDMPIDVSSHERPPEKVMQTAVVGTNGSLTYRLNLDGFPGFGWAVTYFAEIEDLKPTESRKFRLVLPGYPEMSKAIVNIQENAQGKYRLYQPGYTNISLPFVLSFRFGKTSDSTKGPLLNAMEINKYLEKHDGSLDGEVIASVISPYASADWAQEGGDPCLPVPWSWLQCNSDAQPRIVKISLSGKNLTGNIPSNMPKLNGLVELYVQNNLLSGTVPSSLLNKNIVFNYSGNLNLHEGGRRGKHVDIIIGSSVGTAVLLIATIASCLFIRRGKRSPDQERLRVPAPVQRLVSAFNDTPAEGACRFKFSEIEDATNKFEKKIGSGGFGVVHYGRMRDGKEIAVKVLTSNSYQGKREFSNEVTLLSRIHHRNLVQFFGFCQEEGRSMLVYEFMHNGTLKEHLYGPLTRGKSINWIKRLEIAEDAAKGIEYLHTGCVPAIIHRDLKTSNILLDKHMRAKVSDFGLSKVAVDGASHVSSIVRGTVGYLDPEYYISQQLTDKSDVYSFGVILLELMSGQEAILNESFGVNCRNIVQWAKLHIESGDIQGIIDPLLHDEYDIQSMWKIAEKALMCVQPHGHMRPSISEVLKEIQDAILIEREAVALREGNSDMSKNSAHSSLNLGPLVLGGTENFLSLDESVAKPTAR
ncbi:probable LRR receptor-like serine/threonine-protein kinase At1g67720 isoform X2 [Hevea brasiliensis]|uniref:probable LRR receptor-like serine/threonine-protein kinase At1g67720 isoform X2 n=1 Tax=Hevea brasiliensis TaxID=3981 RepID=UPI0025DC329C|nr:probable LRR receptor-like serine/threonine-protein kinase At1g67720 isoform X2 [Hevea brasiliensis]